MDCINIIKSTFSFYVLPKKKKTKQLDSTNEHFISLGKFQFYPEENKLKVKAIEINLSKKKWNCFRYL
ncbi:hypothetical protein H9X57_03570 [Flavobacterium piscinae]|nr:hypothetical protein [Flavobacterium piscinae]